MAMDGTSGGVGQDGNNTYPPASGSGTNNPPAPTAAPVAAPAAAPVAPLPGSITGLFPNTNPMPPANASYVHRPVHMGTVVGHQNPLSAGFLTNGQSNALVGRMIADHLLFLRTNRITPGRTYFSQGMED